MAEHRPLHEAEVAFLKDGADMVALPRHGRGVDGSTEPPIVALAFVPFLPLGKQTFALPGYGERDRVLTSQAVAFLVVPTFLGRVVTTGFVTAVFWWCISGTESRQLLRDYDWAIGIVACVSSTHV